MQPHATLVKFRYPQTLIRNYKHWVVVLRVPQLTLGSCVIINKSETTAVGDISAEAFAEFARIAKDVETALKAAFSNDKINYLALMMLDPQVHFHALPRYEAPRDFAGHHFADTGWPKPPALADIQELIEDQLHQIQQKLIDHWPK